MNPTTLDRVSRAFAERRLSRRATIKASALGLAGGAVGLAAHRVDAQDATPPASDEAATPLAGDSPLESTEFLFVQTAASGTFRTNPDAGVAADASGTPTPGMGAEYLLTLDNHHGQTIYFSDRPERVFGQGGTQAFLDGLGFSPDNPPNAAIVAESGDGQQDVLVVELLSPVYDEATATLTYGANVLPGDQAVSGLSYAAAQQTDGTISAEFSSASLFIDDCADKDIVCYSNVKGVPASWRGDLGVHGMCFTFSEMACYPCGGGEQGMAVLCTQTFPDQCYGTASLPNQCVAQW